MIVCILLGANNHFLVAQEAASSTSQSFLLPGEINPADTLPVYFSLLTDPTTRYAADDTMPDLAFRMYDPARKAGAFDYGHLGNLGSSARPLGFSPASRIGFESGMHAFDLYQLQPDQLRFYRHARTYSHAGFSRGRTQRDGASYIRLSRTFSGGLNFSLHYQTFNNLGEFRFQRAKHSALSAGIWWPIRKNYEIFLVYSANTNQQEDNGGIFDLSFFNTKQFLSNGPISVPTRFSAEAKTKHKRNNLQLTQYGTLGKSRNQLRLEHTLNYITESWKFSDKNVHSATITSAEELFYAPYFTDLRGVRHYFDVQRLQNHVRIRTLRKDKKGMEAGSITAGMRHALINLYREPLSDSLINNYFLTSSIALRPGNKLSVQGNGDLGFLANQGEYRLNGQLYMALGKAGTFQASLLSQRRPPDMIHAHLISAAAPVWDNRFKKVIENSVSATYGLPKLGFSVTASNHIVNNYLYFNQAGLPVQTDSVIQVSQLMVQQNFRFWKLRSDNSFALQQMNNEDILHLPNWFIKNSLSVEGKLFKKALQANAGVDFRMSSAFTPDAYQPLIGQFQLQDTLRQAPYPWLDAFVGVKIQTFRLYFRFENMATLWNPSENLYLTANHPQNRQTFRLGISWRFLDSNVQGETSSGNGSGGQNSPPPGVGGSSSGRRGR